MDIPEKGTCTEETVKQNRIIINGSGDKEARSGCHVILCLLRASELVEYWNEFMLERDQTWELELRPRKQ